MVCLLPAVHFFLLSALGAAPSRADEGNLLERSDLHWKVGGAGGSEVQMEDTAEGSVLLKREAGGEGTAMFYCEKLVGVRPDTRYEVSITFESLSPDMPASVMVSTDDSNRRPFPRSASGNFQGKPGNVSLKLKTRPTENALRIHLVLEGAGVLRVDQVGLQELPPINGTTLRREGDLLRETFHPFRMAKALKSPEGVAASVLPSGGFESQDVDWEAAKVRAVEVRFRAFDEPGFLTLAWTTEDKKTTSYMTRAVPADGVWRDLVFDVSSDPQWKGRIKSLKLDWGNAYNPARIELARVEGKPVLNLIPAAERIPPDAPVEIPLIRPRARYALEWRGEKAPGMEIRFRDSRGAETGKFEWNPDAGGTFEVPALATRAELTVHKPGEGFPLLRLMSPALPNLPENWWTAEWIWSRQGASPEAADIWFEKSFDLDETGLKVAALAVTSDDSCTVFLNGREFPGNKEWEQPVKRDVLSALRPGRNEIVVKVHNAGAFGGLLFELFLEEKNGKSRRVVSDKSWHFAEGGTTRPDAMKSEVFVLGAPPVAPWGMNVSFPGVGPAKNEKPPAAEEPEPGLADAKVVGSGRRAWFEIDGQRVSPIQFDMPISFTRSPEEQAHLAENLERMGVDVVRIHLLLRDVWTSPDKFDFSGLDAAVNTIRRNAPRARVLINLVTRMPEWWLAANPDEAIKYHEPGVTRSLNDDFQSLASKKWIADIRPAIFKIVGHVRAAPYGKRVFGMATNDGATTEWLWNTGHYGKGNRLHADYSKAFVSRFREYLQAKYGADEGLRKAWGREDVSLAEALPPEPERWEAASRLTLLDPSKERDLMDFFAFRSEAVSDSLLALAHTVKEASEGRWLTGAYYGYLIFFGHTDFWLQEGGHLALNKVASSPDIDFLYGPSAYHWRRLGAPDGTMQPAEAVTSHGKMLILEYDMRTYTEPLMSQTKNGRVDTVEDSIGIMERGLALVLARGLGAHYMEMRTTWFQEPVLMEEIKRQEDFYRQLPETPSGTTPIEVCMVSDDAGPLFTKLQGRDGIHTLLLYELPWNLAKANVAYRHVLLKDLLEEGRVGPHKLYLFGNILSLDAAQRAEIRERLQKENTDAIFLYAPGVFKGMEGPAAGNIGEFLGIAVEELREKRPLTMKSEIGGWETFSSTSSGPWYLPVKGFDETIATLPGGAPAMVMRTDGGRRVYFSAVPNLPPTAIRELARKAGAHVYSEGNDPMHIGNDFVALHAASGGIKTISAPPGTKLTGVYGPVLGELEEGSRFQARPGRTYIFEAVRAQPTPASTESQTP